MSKQNPSGPAGSSDPMKGRVNEQSTDVVDWSKNCVPIGLMAHDGSPTPWEGASVTDLKILINLLDKPLTLLMGDGSLTKFPPMTAESEFLRKLIAFAKGAVAYSAAQESLRSRRTS